MKNLGEIKESKDITTKEYVDGKMVIIDNTDIIEKINSEFNGYDSYVFNVSELLTEDEKNKLKNADAVQLALEKLSGNSYYRIALHKTESEEYFQGTGIVTSTINDVNTMSFVRFVSYFLMEIKPVPIGYANTNPNIFGDFSYVNKNYVNNQISTAGEGKFLPLVDGGRITNSEHPSLTGTLITSTGIAVDGDNEPHARYGTEAYFYQKSEASDAMTEISYSGVYISKGGANKELTGLHPNLLEFKSGNGVVSGLAMPTTNTQAANKAYVDSLSFSLLTTEVNSENISSDNFISIIDLNSDDIDFVDSDSQIIYFQYQNQGLKNVLNSNAESILASYDIFLDIPTPTTERYPLYKLPEPLTSVQEAASTEIYYSSGVIELELVEQAIASFIVLAGRITKSTEGASYNRLIFINLSVSP